MYEWEQCLGEPMNANTGKMKIICAQLATWGCFFGPDLLLLPRNLDETHIYIQPPPGVTKCAPQASADGSWFFVVD